MCGRGAQAEVGVCGTGGTAAPPPGAESPHISGEGGGGARQPRGLTWGGGLVDDVLAVLLGNHRVAHGQEGEELLYAGGCGLQTGHGVTQSVRTPLTYAGVSVKSSLAENPVPGLLLPLEAEM